MSWTLVFRSFGCDRLTIVPVQGHPQETVAAADRQKRGGFVIGSELAAVCLTFHVVSKIYRGNDMRRLRLKLKKWRSRFRCGEMVIDVIERGKVQPESPIRLVSVTRFIGKKTLRTGAILAEELDNPGDGTCRE